MTELIRRMVSGGLLLSVAACTNSITPTPIALPDGPVVFSHATAETITEAFASCSSLDPDTQEPVAHAESSYFQVFDVAARNLEEDFLLTEFDFAVHTASSLGGSQPVSVILHILDGEDIQNGVLTEFARQELSLQDMSKDTHTVTFDPPQTVAKDTRLAVEIYTASDQENENLFILGLNNSPHNGPSYLRLPDCGVTETAELGAAFPELSLDGFLFELRGE